MGIYSKYIALNQNSKDNALTNAAAIIQKPNHASLKVEKYYIYNFWNVFEKAAILLS